jgi:hypothetical protein
MLHANPNKILPRLPTDEEAAFFDRDGNNVDIESGGFKTRVSVVGCDGFGDDDLVSRGASKELKEI